MQGHSQLIKPGCRALASCTCIWHAKTVSSLELLSTKNSCTDFSSLTGLKRQKPNLNTLPSCKLTWQCKIPILCRKYIFKWSVFHCYVSLPEGTYKYCKWYPLENWHGSPENGGRPLEEEIPSGSHHFQVNHVSFRGSTWHDEWRFAAMHLLQKKQFTLIYSPNTTATAVKTRVSKCDGTGIRNVNALANCPKRKVSSQGLAKTEVFSINSR